MQASTNLAVFPSLRFQRLMQTRPVYYRRPPLSLAQIITSLRVLTKNFPTRLSRLLSLIRRRLFLLKQSKGKSRRVAVSILGISSLEPVQLEPFFFLFSLFLIPNPPPSPTLSYSLPIMLELLLVILFAVFFMLLSFLFAAAFVMVSSTVVSFLSPSFPPSFSVSSFFDPD